MQVPARTTTTKRSSGLPGLAGQRLQALRTALHPQHISALACLALTCVWVAACGSSVRPPARIASAAAIWVQPLPAAAEWPMGAPAGGSTDFLALFQADAPWPRAMARTQVVGLYAAWITDIGPEVLQSMVAFLNTRNIAIEIEAPALRAEATCGSGVEGYVPYGLSIDDFTLDYLQRLKNAGARQIFIKVDEPYFFGTVVDDPRSCHFPVEVVAAEVGQYVQLVRTVFPDAVVGDVEPVIPNGYPPDVVTAMGHWHDVYKTVTGAPFPFYFADIDFTNPGWPATVKALEDQTRQAGMRFGIIYIGDQFDTSDAEWAGKVVARFHLYQGATGGQPDYVFFQSWEPHPSRCLPESDPNTITGVIDAYLDAMS